MAALKWNDSSSTQNDKHSLATAAAAAAISGFCELWVAHFRGTSDQNCSNLSSCTGSDLEPGRPVPSWIVDKLFKGTISTAEFT
jgi:hypothetical protein